MTEAVKTFGPRSLRGPKGEFRQAVKRSIGGVREKLDADPTLYEGLKFTRFEDSNYSSQQSAQEQARTAVKVALEADENLDWRVELAADGRWYIWFRLEAK
jgi:hypothetical protein